MKSKEMAGAALLPDQRGVAARVGKKDPHDLRSAHAGLKGIESTGLDQSFSWATNPSWAIP